jgi:hypothetical protein
MIHSEEPNNINPNALQGSYIIIYIPFTLRGGNSLYLTKLKGEIMLSLHLGGLLESIQNSCEGYKEGIHRPVFLILSF